MRYFRQKSRFAVEGCRGRVADRPQQARLAVPVAEPGDDFARGRYGFSAAEHGVFAREARFCELLTSRSGNKWVLGLIVESAERFNKKLVEFNEGFLMISV